MKPDAFRCPEAGAIHRSFAGNDTFVPAPLPPAITYDNALVLALSRADAALSELSGVGRQLPNPHLLIAPYLRQEAVLSSRIEGTQTEFAELLRADVGEGNGGARAEADRREVRNYTAAMEEGIGLLQTGRPITLNLVRSLHETLMAGVRGDGAAAGQFRTLQNWIGGVTIDRAVYVPPPPELLMPSLGDWERFVNTRDTMPDLVQCAIMHEQFEAIHPFNDGNGRIGRLLVPLFLMDRQRLSQPLLNISAFIEPHRGEYYDRLQRVLIDCDWPGWIHFFLVGVTQTARQAVQQAILLVTMREDFLRRTRERPNAQALVDALFVNPYITASRARTLLGVSDPTSRKALAVLESAGIITLIERQRPALYLSEPILGVLEGLGPMRG
ncbi:MAG: Fic family protein [Thermomicrobiales bacterium]